ncbi:orotate phosphoribosyltransferase [Kroppenstedtia eburnea]|uniref:Orotate phosphoribosyltransferase n=1 Tax=Kroppenstedtia eburnea TaxID=714067 RepID=A0A1N7J3T8_9BACL|nr:orotate phosphoribosyltransferase [Kroppenstedtia eburnea]QKI82476.1 orotate phosphoribosyltransferase [Kroppenstedtia eburnea]SIS43974.1 orotate phosphoribosyltransferase [Kroppenstedtia eburnea]
MDKTQMWRLEEAMERRGVLKEGHFFLSSGRHSARYMQCAQLLQHPGEAEAAGAALAELFREEEVDVVVGPALGGVIIAHETARALGVRCLFAERKEGKMTLRRGFTLQPGERVLLVEDVVTTGGSVGEVADLVQAEGATVVGIASLVDRSGGRAPFQAPFRSLMQQSIESFDPADCPLCKQGMPVEKPGSRQTEKV